MMKKTSSALAIAALLGTGAASAATFQVNDDMAVSIDGRVYYGYTDTDNNSGESVSSFDDYSRFQLGTENDLGNGLTAFSGVRINTDQFDDDGDNGLSMSRTFVGVEGDFGTATVGNYGKVYDSLLSITDVFDNFAPTASDSDASQRQIRYSAPTMNGLTVHVGAGFESDTETSNQGNSSSFEAGVSYELGGATLFAAYDQAKLITGNTDEDANYGLGATTSVGGADVGVVYHNNGSSATDQEVTGLVLTVPYAAGSISGSINNVDPETGDSRTELNLVARYNLASNMYVSAEYQVADKANDEDDGYGLSVYYGF